MRARRKERGSALLEMTLVGIPIIFVLISIFEMARGMWVYHTLAYAVREGTRYAIVHGKNCSALPNTCAKTVGDVARRIKDAGVGLPPGELDVTMRSLVDNISCKLSACVDDTRIFPQPGGGVTGSPITIEARYPFRSAISMFWPGAGSVSVGTVNLPAKSEEAVQF